MEPLVLDRPRMTLMQRMLADFFGMQFCALGDLDAVLATLAS